jgi:hypothetical protein
MFWVYLLSCDGLVMFAVLRTHVGSNPRPHVLSIVDLEVLSKAGTLQDRLNTGTPSPLSLALFLSHLVDS